MNTKKKDVRINGEIKCEKVRLIDLDGKQIGVIDLKEALRLSEEREMDLVEVSQDADPSVCKIMDYGKFKYQMLKKQHLVKKKSKGGKLKEIKLRPKTEEHDYAFKLKHIKTSIEEGNKVKISVVFRGREVSYMEKGVDMLNKIVEDTKEEAIIEIQPKVEGRNLYMMLTPKKTSKGV